MTAQGEAHALVHNSKAGCGRVAWSTLAWPCFNAKGVAAQSPVSPQTVFYTRPVPWGWIRPPFSAGSANSVKDYFNTLVSTTAPTRHRPRMGPRTIATGAGPPQAAGTRGIVSPITLPPRMGRRRAPEMLPGIEWHNPTVRQCTQTDRLGESEPRTSVRAVWNCPVPLDSQPAKIRAS
jgi:hypothetical protein